MHRPALAVFTALLVASVRMPAAFGTGTCTEVPGVPIALETTPQQLSPLVAQMRDFPTQLDPRIFCGNTLKPAVAERATSIVTGLFGRLTAMLPATDYVTGSDGAISAVPVTYGIGAIELLGSEAGYEYDAKSDLGIHVFLSVNGSICTNVTEDADGNEVTDCAACAVTCQINRTVKTFNSLVELQQEPSLTSTAPGITFDGMTVEVTFHASRGPSYQVFPARGHWSITENRWLNFPIAQPDLSDAAQMTADAVRWIAKYNELACRYIASPDGFDCGLFGDLDDELGTYRNDGIVAAGGNTRCTSNLTYRLLRRLPSVNIPDTVDALEQRCNNLEKSLRACIGDLDCDNMVSGSDITLLIANWGPCAHCREDINADGLVDSADLLLLLNNWGDCR
jgi:hypothetical protein